MVSALSFPKPIVENIRGISVVRDDYLNGGTKTRFLSELFYSHDCIVYASPAEGGAQVALAESAKLTGKQAVIFVAKRKEPHFRTIQAAKAGAIVYQVPHGYLSNVQAKAKRYAVDNGAFYLEFGADIPLATQRIAEAAESIGGVFDEIWCAAGSGVLSRGLGRAFFDSMIHAVQIGREPHIPANAILHVSPLEFSKRLKNPDFPSCPHYDAKAWDICKAESKGRVLFWNVLGE